MSAFWQDFQEASLLVFLPALEWLLVFAIATAILLMLTLLAMRVLRRVL